MGETPVNRPLVAVAGADQTIALPANSVAPTIRRGASGSRSISVATDPYTGRVCDSGPGVYVTNGAPGLQPCP